MSLGTKSGVTPNDRLYYSPKTFQGTLNSSKEDFAIIGHIKFKYEKLVNTKAIIKYGKHCLKSRT